MKRDLPNFIRTALEKIYSVKKEETEDHGLNKNIYGKSSVKATNEFESRRKLYDMLRK